MQTMLRVGLLCVLTVSGLGQATARAATGPELIPQSAAMVIRMQAPKTALKEASTFVDEVQPGYGQLVLGQVGMLGVGISNPQLLGVDQSKDWYAAVFLEQGEEPSVVFIIPATDAAEMDEALDDKFSFVAHEGFGVYSEQVASIELMKKHFASSTSPSMASVASERMKSFVGKAHLAVAVNLEVIKVVYQDDLLSIRDQVLEGMQQAQQEMPEVPGIKLEWLPGLMEQIVDKAEVAVRDAKAYSVSLTLASTGLRVDEYMEFASRSSSSTFLQKFPPDGLTAIQKLPAGQLAYGSFSKSLASLNAWGMNFLPKILELNEEQTASWAEAQKLISEMNFGSSAGSFDLGDLENGLIRGTTLAQVNPTSKFRMTMDKIVEVMDGLEFPGMKQEMTLEKNAETIDNVEVDLLITTQEIEEDGQFGGLQEQINAMLYGPDGNESRVAYMSDAYLQTVGGGSDAMKSAITAFKASSGQSDEVIARDMKPLGTENVAIGLIDLQTLIVKALKIAVSSPLLPPMPFDQEQLDELKVERSYIGVSMSTVDNGFTGTLHIPKQTLQAGMQLFGFFQTVQQEQNAF